MVDLLIDWVVGRFVRSFFHSFVRPSVRSFVPSLDLLDGRLVCRLFSWMLGSQQILFFSKTGFYENTDELFRKQRQTFRACTVRSARTFNKKQSIQMQMTNKR